MKITIKDIDNKGGVYTLRTFSSKKDARTWIMEGLRSCEGAEREHYVDMLMQLEGGATTLYYNEPPSQVQTDLEYAFAHFDSDEEIREYMKQKGWMK